jgi:hypothetical protein
MAVTLTLLRQLRGVNYKKSVIQAVMSGSYVNPTGELVNLNAASVLNPSALDFTGPNPSDSSLPAVVAAQSIGGWQAQLAPVPGSPNQFNLTFWNGTTQLGSGTYASLAAAIASGILTFEQEWDLGS